MRDFDAKAQELGTVGAANQWMRENGYELEPAMDDEELPAVESQGALDAVAGGGDVDAENDTGFDPANLDFSKLRADPAVFQQLLQANVLANQRAEQSAKQLYEQGRQRIMEKYAGPSQAERLYSLSRAMLSPTDFRGFKGLLGNVTGALSENAKAARMAEQAREEQLFNLQQQYQQGVATRAAGLPKTAADLAAKYLAATKPAARSSASPVIVGADMRPRIRATGAEFREPPQSAIYILQQYVGDPNNTPENKMIARRNFDKRFGYGAHAIYVGEE